MTRPQSSHRLDARHLAAWLLLSLLGACASDPTGTAVLSVIADSSTVTPPVVEPESCDDRFVDDRSRFCLIVDSSNGEQVLDPLSRALQCTCTMSVLK